MTNRLGSADDGTTMTDFDEEEIARKVSISTGLAYAEWNKMKFNLLDTPGYNIFINDTLLTLVAAVENRTDGMNHKMRFQIMSARDLGFTCGATV